MTISMERKELESLLLDIQNDLWFICEGQIDRQLQQPDIDHIVPRARGGKDDLNNLAITHMSCNRSKGASNLKVARALAKFGRLRNRALDEGKRGANLGDVLHSYQGATNRLTLRRLDNRVDFSFWKSESEHTQSMAVFHDSLSNVSSFFASLPLEYLHHDDRINPRDIGTNLRGLLDEFLYGNPQLHVALAWWTEEEDGAGRVKVFDGQHKAAAQILLGVRELPVRIFIDPNTDVLLEANTNAGSKLRQVAFDPAVMRHLGSTLYHERERQYRNDRGLSEGDYSFSEQDLVHFFRGSRREMERYIIDAQRDSITHSADNKLLEFVEWSGKGTERPLL